MPTLLPFAGLRFDCECTGTPLDLLTAPPYDVIDEEERHELAARAPHNAVRLILPEDAQQPGDRYEAAAALLEQWRADGVLRADGARLYTYRMDFTGPHGEARHTAGVIGALVLPDLGDASVLPHERTIPKAKTDRLALLRTTRANLDPIWGLSLAPGLSELITPDVELAECADAGVRHRLGAIDNPERIAAIGAAVAGHELVLADGHHRYETARNYRNERRGDGATDPGAEAIMCFVVELAEDELCIQPIHRLVDLDDGNDGTDIAAVLADAFRVVDVGANTPEGVAALERRMVDEGGIGLAGPTRLTLLVPDDAVCGPALLSEPEPVRDTDAALVESVIVPRLGDARWTYRHSLDECAAIVRAGGASAALLLRPVSVAQTRRVAHAHERMPQKTTFFYPKPRTGMVLRSLDG